MKTYAKRFNAQRAAKAAGHEPDAVEIEQTVDGFVWRLKDAAPAASEGKARAAKPRRAPRGMRARVRFAELEAAARAGKLPPAPDFSAATHARFRNKLGRLVALAGTGDIEALRACEINPVSSSPKAMVRYRDLCIIALEAKTKT